MSTNAPAPKTTTVRITVGGITYEEVIAGPVVLMPAKGAK